MSSQAPQDAPAPAAPSLKVVILAILLPVILFFAALEGAARLVELVAPPRLVDLGQGFTEDSRLFVPAPDDPTALITNPNKLESFQDQRFSKAKAEGVFRVFMLGGSSVNYLHYQIPFLEEYLRLQFPDRMQAAEVINCGGESYGSHRLVLIAAEIVEYSPDLVLLYSAHNEFEELEQLKLAHLKGLPLQRLLGKTALFRFLRDRIASLQISALEKAHNRRIAANSIPDSSRAWSHQFSPEEIDARMANYRKNLATIIDIFQDHAIPIIIGTVPSNLIRPSLPGNVGAAYEELKALFDAGRYDAARERGMAILLKATRHQSSDQENAIIRDLAAEKGVPLADVEQAVIEAEPNHVPGETLFSDHCHLNAQGNELLIAAFKAQIAAILSRP